MGGGGMLFRPPLPQYPRAQPPLPAGPYSSGQYGRGAGPASAKPPMNSEYKQVRGSPPARTLAAPCAPTGTNLAFTYTQRESACASHEQLRHSASSKVEQPTETPNRADKEATPHLTRDCLPQHEAIRKDDNGDVVLSLYGVDIVTVSSHKTLTGGLRRTLSHMTLPRNKLAALPSCCAPSRRSPSISLILLTVREATSQLIPSGPLIELCLSPLRSPSVRSAPSPAQVRPNGDVVLDAGKFRGMKTFQSMNGGAHSVVGVFQ